MEWDSSLFYTLEDIHEDSAEDNQIARYSMTVHGFINGQSGNMMQCFAYAHPDNGQVNKIVTVEQQSENYLVTSPGIRTPPISRWTAKGRLPMTRWNTRC